MTPTAASGSKSPFVLRLGLGLFILVQLAFILLANLGTIAAFLGNAGNTGAAIVWSAIGAFTEPYAFITGQEQYWRMFAPTVPQRSLFVRMRLHTKDGEEMLPSDCEPFASQPQLHLPGSGERMWHVEKSLAAAFIAFDPEEVARRPDEWRTYLKDKVAASRHRYLAYMDWRTRGRSPDRVDFLVSVHSPSRYDARSQAQFEELLLRWVPASKTLELCTKTPDGARCERLDPE